MKDKIWLLALLLIPFVFILIVGIGYLQKETKPLETYSKSGEIKEFYNKRIGTNKQKRMFIVIDDETYYITTGLRWPVDDDILIDTWFPASFSRRIRLERVRIVSFKSKSLVSSFSTIIFISVSFFWTLHRYFACFSDFFLFSSVSSMYSGVTRITLSTCLFWNGAITLSTSKPSGTIWTLRPSWFVSMRNYLWFWKGYILLVIFYLFLLFLMLFFYCFYLANMYLLSGR